MKSSLKISVIILCLGLSACSSTVLYSNKPYKQSDNPSSQSPKNNEWKYMNTSFYGEEHHGKTTASGEVFDMYALTCAHKTLPFGTILTIVNEEKGLETQVKVNDRGPFTPGRDLDISWGAAKKIDMINDGIKVLKVKINN